MAKLYKIENWVEGSPDWNFFCPGYFCDHGVWINNKNSFGARWDWNGDMDKPTFTPSLKITYPHWVDGVRIDDICHFFIRNGNIEYQGDCTHHLAGLTIELADIE